jgi:large subunit ribosomal protein L21
MFAVIRTGGKQYRVAADQTLKVGKLAGETGDVVTFSDVLALGGDSPKLGSPLVSGASVLAEIVEQARDRKIIIFKKRRRQNSRRKNGHRQHFTLLRVTEILADGAKPAAKKKQPPEPKETAKETKATAENAEAASAVEVKQPKARPAPKAKAAEAASGSAPAKKPRARKPAKKSETGPKGSKE